MTDVFNTLYQVTCNLVPGVEYVNHFSPHIHLDRILSPSRISKDDVIMSVLTLPTEIPFIIFEMCESSNQQRWKIRYYIENPICCYLWSLFRTANRLGIFSAAGVKQRRMSMQPPACNNIGR